MWQKILNFLNQWRYQSFYFAFYAGYMPLLLFLPVYLKHVGLSSIQVGIINGMRPILQSLATPLLIILGEKLHSRKLLFILSCVIAISKVLVMFLLIKPQRQLCIVDRMNKSSGVTWHVDKLVHVSLLVGENLPGQPQTILKNRFTKTADLHNEIRSAQNLGNQRGSTSENAENSTTTWNSVKRNLINGNKPANEVSDTWGSLRQKNEEKDIRSKFKILYNERELNRVFTALVLLTLLADPFVASIYTLVDYSCAANSDTARGFKEVRLWETIGWGSMTPMIGLIIYEFREDMCGVMVETFHYMFFFFVAFTIIAMCIGTQLDFTQNVPEVIAKKVQSAQSNLQYGLFSIISAFAGFGHGFLLTFINWFIDSLGGTTVIMGAATTTKSIADIILYWTLGIIIEKFGYVAIISTGLLGHLLLFVIYCSIKSAWQVILTEAMYGFVYGSLMSTCASFLVNVAPAGSSARMQAIFHGIFWGVGMAAGCILSGYHIDTSGFPTAFLTFAGITAFVSLTFLAIQCFLFLRSENQDYEHDDLSDIKLKMENDDGDYSS